MIGVGIKLMERGLLPQWVLRQGIQKNLRARLQMFDYPGSQKESDRFNQFLEELKRSPIALVPEKANEQHYEMPADYFVQVLGTHLKYSSCLWPAEVYDLAGAEEAMLKLYGERAEIQNGMRILELGCGWGSFTLWAAAQFPDSTIVGVSNSASQREFILARAKERALSNIEIITADINDLTFNQTFDRIVSIEMFEHMRNFDRLLQKIAHWLNLDGKLFVHIFCHRYYAYPYETAGEDNWMGRYFFTGGIMPSEELLFHFQRDLLIEQHWRVNGRHYEKTARAWLERHYERRHEIMPILERTYGAAHARCWYHRWAVFYLACAELFGFEDGEQWFVAHYLFQRNPEAPVLQ